ncbi:MAG: VWA domain-containing protein [Lachnospiraceae bacterium]|nr:VWA domain-containing protein [Lachnospiraceae bacterium]
MKKKTTSLLVCVLLVTQLMTFGGGCASSDSGSKKDSGNSITSEKYEELDENTKSDYETETNNKMTEMTDEVPETIQEPPAEEYAEVTENGFITTKKNNTSTFSADVDTASYSNIRRMITNGCTLDEIPSDAVRIEEMLNYFSYNYEKPKKGEPFGVSMQCTKCPWNTENNIVMIGLNTEKVDFKDAPDSNLVFLLDVSGSMADTNKLPLLTKAFSLFTNELDKKDKVSIVTYAGEDKVLLEGVSGDQKDTILTALENLEANGSTNGSAGIETAYKIAKENFIKGGNNRVILATDGDLNVGITDDKELEDFISKKKEEGIFLTTLGFGMGNYKDSKLELLADKGNGNYAYIDNLNEAKKVMVKEMGANFTTVAKDVKLQAVFNPDVVEEYRLIGYENRVMENKDFEDDTKDAGEIGSGHTVTALYEVKISDAYLNSNVLDESEHSKEEIDWLTLKIRYKKPEGKKSTELSYMCGNGNYSTEPSDDLSFAMAVAEFGMILRKSPYIGEGSLNQVVQLAKQTDTSKDTYKSEFVKLVNTIANA